RPLDVPVGVWRRAAVQRSQPVAAGGHVRDERGDEGVEPGDGEALLAPHARPHHHEGLAVPVGPAGQVLGRSVVAQVHRQEVALVATVSPDQAVVLDQLGQRVVERLRQVGGYVVGLDVEREPAARGVLGHPLSLERVGRARPLKNEQCRERTGCRTGGAGELPVDMRAAHVAHPNREELDARSPALARREDRVERDGIEAAQLSAGPSRLTVYVYVPAAVWPGATPTFHPTRSRRSYMPFAW